MSHRSHGTPSGWDDDLTPEPSARDQAIESALKRLIERVEHPRALAGRPEARAAVRRAADRVQTVLLGEAENVLTIALAGCTGAGKSTLINALAGAPIAEAAEQRPCTMRTRVYHHRALPAGGLPPELAAQATFVAHDRPELWHKVLVDTPDLDTFATENRAATRALLKAAGLVLYVFSPEKYWEERAWSVIRDEQRFSACLAVVNKADLVPAAELQRILDEIGRRFAELGHPDVRVLPICAARHVPRADGTVPPAEPGVLDEFLTLRAFIEHELQDGDIARMLRQQRERVLANLSAAVESLTPPDLTARLDRLSSRAETLATEAGDQLATRLSDRLSAAADELKPMAALRRHEQFFGPFRLWLSAGDALIYGLPRLVRRLRLFGGDGSGSNLAPLLVTDQAEAASDLLRAQARRLQDGLYADGLPLERWAALTADASGTDLLTATAGGLEARFEAAAALGARRRRWVARGASLAGIALPVGLSAYALYALLRSLAAGQVPGGFTMLGLMFSLTILAYVVLHGLITPLLSAAPGQSGSELGRLAVHEALKRTLHGWVDGYRRELEADLAELAEPLQALQAAAEPPRVSLPPPVARPAVAWNGPPPAVTPRLEPLPAPAAPVAMPSAVVVTSPPPPVWSSAVVTPEGPRPVDPPTLVRPSPPSVPPTVEPQPEPLPVDHALEPEDATVACPVEAATPPSAPEPPPQPQRLPVRERLPEVPRTDPRPPTAPAGPALSPAEALREAMKRHSRKP